MNRLLLVIVFFILLLNQSKAQQSKWKFFNITSAGIMQGSSGYAITGSTTNGIKKKTYSLGIGLAYDTYGYASIPAFIDARKYFNLKKKKLFVYGDFGINYSLYSNDLPKDWSLKNTYIMTKNDFVTTAFAEVGIGFNKKLNKLINITTSLGFSYKHLSYNQFTYYIYFPPTTAPIIYENDYNFYYRRMVLKLGISFN